MAFLLTLILGGIIYAKSLDNASNGQIELKDDQLGDYLLVQGNSLMPISPLPEKIDYCSENWLSHYWPQNQVKNASKVCWCESKGNPQEVNNSLWGVDEYSVGLFQINILAHTQFTEEYLKVPDNNVKEAVKIYNKDGWWKWYWCAKAEEII